MLTAEMLAKLDACVRFVAQHDYGSVKVMVERGRARRVHLEVEFSWDDIPEQLLQLNTARPPTNKAVKIVGR